MRRQILIVAMMLGLTACGDSEQTAGEQSGSAADGDTEWVGIDQVHRDDPGATEARAGTPAATAADAFFDALRAGDIDAAAARVAREPLEFSDTELRTDLSQWISAQEGMSQDFEVLGALERGDFAIARVSFPVPGQEQPQARPVVLYQEQGEWRVVWDLLGKAREQVAAADQARLEPLYDWYDEQSLRAQTPDPVPAEG